MTTAPANLLAARTLLLEHLDIAPGSPSADLTPAEVGIVGDPAHKGGGHCGSDRVTRNSKGVITDYTVVESSRDRAGLTLDAAALDVGWFEVRVGGKAHNLRTFSVWCVAQCKAKKPDTKDIREIIYSDNGKTVKRYDVLGRRTTGDSSHLSHTHFTFFRDAIKARRDQTPLFRRYLTEIGLIEPEPIAAPPREDNDMLMLKLPKDATVWLSRDWGDGVQRVALVAEDEMPPDTPLITVASEARLTLIGGPERKSAS